MSPAAEILVIILSIFLAFFLVLATVLVIYLIILTKQIRRVTASAERTFDNFGSVIAGISKAVSPMVIAKMVSSVIKKFNGNRRGRKEDV